MARAKSRKGGTRKRRVNRDGIGRVMATLSTAGRPWYIGRWAATGRKTVRGVRRKVWR